MDAGGLLGELVMVAWVVLGTKRSQQGVNFHITPMLEMSGNDQTATWSAMFEALANAIWTCL